MDVDRHAYRNRLLLVEDHRDTALAASLMLGHAGYDVVAAGNVCDAQKLVKEQKFGAVIIDIGLPDGDGYDLMKSIHKRFGIRGVGISGFVPNETTPKPSDVGFSELICKPFAFEQLRAAIQRVTHNPT